MVYAVTVFCVAVAGIIVMFQTTFLPVPLFTLGTGGVLFVIFHLWRWQKKLQHPMASRLMTFSLTLCLVMVFGSLAYQHWQWEQMVSKEFMLRITMVFLGLAGVYANIMYMRAEKAYRQKRGNQRISENPDEGYKAYKKDVQQAKNKQSDELVTVLGYSVEQDNLPIVWKGKDMFTHMLVVGATRSGKTASVLEPMIYQLLLQRKQGKSLGLSVVEPKGEFAEKVKDFCDEMDIPYIYIDPTKPDTHKFNPLEGNVEDVVEGTVIVLRGLFGKQDAFFANVQELAARNVTRLLKELKGDDTDLMEVLETLRDFELLQQRTNELRMEKGETDLVHSIENELLGSMAEKYKQFVIGLRAQLENITSNELLKNIMSGKSDIDIDEHFANDGVLIVNTALGTLKKAGDAFGQFLIMHLQNGTFRRPGTEDTRSPHFMVIDEYKRYINPQVEIFLSLAASYRVSGVLASQSLGQLEVEAGDIGPRAMKQAIMTNCRNKLCFNGVGFQDAQEFADEFGKDKIMVRQSTYKHRVILPTMFPDSYRDTESEEYRFDPTDIMDNLPKYSFIHKVMYEAAMQKPALARGSLVPSDWKEKREWEDHSVKAKLQRAVYQAGAKTGTGLKKQLKWLSKARQQKADVILALPKPEEDVKDDFVQSQSLSIKDVSNAESQKELDKNSEPVNQMEQQEELHPLQETEKAAESLEDEKEQQHTSATPAQSKGQANDGFWD